MRAQAGGGKKSRSATPRSTRSCRDGKVGAQWSQLGGTRGKCPSALGAEEESPRRDEGTTRWRTAGLRVGEEGEGTGPVSGELRGLVAGGSRPWGGSTRSAHARLMSACRHSIGQHTNTNTSGGRFPDS
jgi:hypothetical protein